MNAVEVKNTNEDDSTVHVAQAVGDTLLKSINFNKLENNFFYTYNSTKDLKFFFH
ncbi:MAG: hypothetical protein IPP48_06525 [Chitinophagaceae bacterium]|nr:hypothetical protein [Chitinophagaceae bacterium]